MTTRDERMEKGRESAFETEHWLAWLMLLAALALGLIGILRGFGIIGDTSDIAAAEEGTIVFRAEFADALVWMIPGFAAALLAMALHSNEHHRGPRPDRLASREKGLFATEHMLAWLMAIATIVAGVLCLLVGFDVLGNDNTQQDGIVWGFASLIYGASTYALHSVRHHQLAGEEDYLVAMVEERVGGRTATGSTQTSEGRRSI